LVRLTLKVVMKYYGEFVDVTVLQVAKISRCYVHAVLFVTRLRVRPNYNGRYRWSQEPPTATSRIMTRVEGVDIYT